MPRALQDPEGEAREDEQEGRRADHDRAPREPLRGRDVAEPDGDGPAREDRQELVAERERLGLDYGKFDFVVHEGRPVLLDAAPTPSYGFRGGGREVQQRISATLAAGLEGWLRQS